MNKQTEIVKASEIRERVIQRLFDIRNPEALPAYQKALRQYKRRRGAREEVEVTSNGFFDLDLDLSERTKRGFYVLKNGRPTFVQRPRRQREIAYFRMNYDRSFGGSPTHARDLGMLADGGLYNREIREGRVKEYAQTMLRGEWQDLLSDPIAVTSDGHVLNGQHRLAAVEYVAVYGGGWEAVANDPSFLVVWNVDPREALHADGSRRTARDEKTIATKLLTGRQS